MSNTSSSPNAMVSSSSTFSSSLLSLCSLLSLSPLTSPAPPNVALASPSWFPSSPAPQSLWVLVKFWAFSCGGFVLCHKFENLQWFFTSEWKWVCEFGMKEWIFSIEFWNFCCFFVIGYWIGVYVCLWDNWNVFVSQSSGFQFVTAFGMLSIIELWSLFRFS